MTTPSPELAAALAALRAAAAAWQEYVNACDVLTDSGVVERYGLENLVDTLLPSSPAAVADRVAQLDVIAATWHAGF